MTDTVVFSLTDAGRRLGDRLVGSLPGLEHRHRPEPFIDSARQAFSAGRRCVFICAAGIVVRALAPALAGKRSDPAVLVLDEAGRFVIPLLSGHEGGACELGRRVAGAIGAELVVTSATDYSRPVHCVGVGTDRGCPQALLAELYGKAVCGLEAGTKPEQVASIDLKKDEPAVLALAECLGATLQCFSAAELRTVEDQLTEKSDLVFRETGCYGVAEAAALLAASRITGNPAELVVAKRRNARATIAVARSYR